MAITWWNWCSKRVWWIQRVLVVVWPNAPIQIALDNLIEPFRHVARCLVQNWIDFLQTCVATIPWMFDFRPLAPDWRRESRSLPFLYCSVHLCWVGCASESRTEATAVAAATAADRENRIGNMNKLCVCVFIRSMYGARPCGVWPVACDKTFISKSKTQKTNLEHWEYIKRAQWCIRKRLFVCLFWFYFLSEDHNRNMKKKK